MKLELTEQQIQAILNALAEAKLKDSIDAFLAIQQQAQNQPPADDE